MLVLFDSINDVGKLKFVTFAILISHYKTKYPWYRRHIHPKKIKDVALFFCCYLIICEIYTIFMTHKQIKRCPILRHKGGLKKKKV